MDFGTSIWRRVIDEPSWTGSSKNFSYSFCAMACFRNGLRSMSFARNCSRSEAEEADPKRRVFQGAGNKQQAPQRMEPT
jgi:hypothetical protein